MSRKIYVVEDDENIREIISYTLKTSGFQISAFEDGDEFFNELLLEVPQLIILDIMLPAQNGYDILKKLKGNKKFDKIPVIFLTAKTGEMDKVQGLDLGADDYIAKPFGILELVARVKAVLRRYEISAESQSDEDKYYYKDLIIDIKSKQIFKDNIEIKLTYTEYELFLYLYLNRGIVISRENLLNVIWGNDFECESRTVDVHIRSLRHKFNDNADSPNYIATIRGHGYKLLKE